MTPSRMTYEYSTRNFHRYVDPSGTIREVYIPRAAMPQPVLSIEVTPKVLDAQVVAEKVKPARERV